MRERKDYSNHTREQLQKLVELADLSIPSLQFALAKAKQTSKDRMVRLNRARDTIYKQRLLIEQLQKEAHGG